MIYIRRKKNVKVKKERKCLVIACWEEQSAACRRLQVTLKEVIVHVANSTRICEEGGGGGTYKDHIITQVVSIRCCYTMDIKEPISANKMKFLANNNPKS